MVLAFILRVHVLQFRYPFRAACGGAREKMKMKRGHLALRQGDCVPLLPLLKSYVHIAETEGYLEEVVFEGIAGGPGAGRDAEFAIDRLHVDIDGMGAQDELLSNLVVGQPLGD